MLAPVLELSIFIQSRLLDPEARRIVTPSRADVNPALSSNLPDLEIMPVRPAHSIVCHHVTKYSSFTDLEW